MTYSKIYNQLDKAGLIEKIMVETNFDKLGIIEGIQYLENFLGSTTFNGMRYWTDANCNKTVALVCTEYAKLQILNNKKFIDKFEYMSKTMAV